MFEYRMDHAFGFRAGLTAPEVIGPLPGDIRVNFYITGGEVWGPLVQGKLRAAGGDWLTVRTDGVAVLDVRGTIETHDEALIYMEYHGIIDFGADGYAKFLAGDLPASANIRTAPKLRSAHPDYAWVNRAVFVGIGEYRAAENCVIYDVYAVR
jgi:hypothetical protein